MHMNGAVLKLEIKTVIPGAQTVKGLPLPLKPAERFARMGQILGLYAGNWLKKSKLSQLIHAIDLAHRLLGKGDLKHGG